MVKAGMGLKECEHWCRFVASNDRWPVSMKVLQLYECTS